MLCADFEDRLTDYIEGTLAASEGRAFAEHAMRCPVCHDLLSEVRNTINACQVSEPIPPPAELEARILMKTMPGTAMTCAEFEECLTDYLDGFLPASLYHRWERHAALCESCTELPGQVVRSIGACYTYINEEKPVPVGLHERILQATLGTTQAEERRAPLFARIGTWMRLLLDPIMSPQLATVATMLLVAVLVLTSTVSADGSIGGIYRASVRMAEKSYEANTAVKGITNGITDFMSGQQQQPATAPKKDAAKPEQSTEQKNR